MLDNKHRRVMTKLVDKEERFAKPAIEISRREANRMIRDNNTRYWSI